MTTRLTNSGTDASKNKDTTETAIPAPATLALTEQPFLKDLDPRFIEQMADCAFTTRFEPGQQICREGEPADRFYILVGGQVALEMYAPGARGAGEAHMHTVQTLYEWEPLGWSWLFPPYRWHFDVRALTPVEALAFDARCLRGKCEQDHDLGYELMKRFTQIVIERLQAARFQMMDVYRVPE